MKQEIEEIRINIIELEKACNKNIIRVRNEVNFKNIISDIKFLLSYINMKELEITKLQNENKKLKKGVKANDKNRNKN